MWQAQYSVMLEKHLCCSNDVSYVTRINHESSTGVVLCSTGVVLCSTE